MNKQTHYGCYGKFNTLCFISDEISFYLCFKLVLNTTKGCCNCSWPFW